MMRVGAVVLAAGASRRLGEPKQLVMLGKETLLERAVRTAREAGCSPVVVVVGAEHSQVLGKCVLGDAATVINDQWAEGMASSIRLGVQTLESAAKDVEGVLLMTCDQPAVTVKHLLRLMREPERKASRYARRSGVPAFFPKKYFDQLMKLKGDAGARELLAEARYEELENGELDVDTPTDLERARKMFG
jgi:CTP:molybdopterin cytidylyltransferase MocA